jgi:hypothetical protein
MGGDLPYANEIGAIILMMSGRPEVRWASTPDPLQLVSGLIGWARRQLAS